MYLHCVFFPLMTSLPDTGNSQHSFVLQHNHSKQTAECVQLLRCLRQFFYIHSFLRWPSFKLLCEGFLFIYVLVLFCGCDKHNDQEQSGEERVYINLQVTLTEGNQGGSQVRNSLAETTEAFWLATMFKFSYLFMYSRPTFLGLVMPIEAGPSSIN